jgi:hypothetical protein
MATFLQTSGSISMSQINTVFGRGTNLNAYRGTTYYTATTGPNTFPSTSSAISFNNFYGTGPDSGAVVVDINELVGTWDSYYAGSLPVTVVLTFFTNGGLQMTSTGTTFGLFNGGDTTFWVTPPSSTIGNSYWISWTRVGVVGSNGSSTLSTGGRVPLSTDRAITVSKSSGGTIDYTAEYDIEIWDSPEGGTQVGNAPGMTIAAFRTLPP